MTRWKCVLCDYVFDSAWPPARCPRCGAGREKFVKINDEAKDTN